MELMGFHRDIGLNQCWPVRNRARFVHKASSVRKLANPDFSSITPLRSLADSGLGKTLLISISSIFRCNAWAWTMSLDANFGKVSDGSGVWSGVLRSELKDSGIGKAPSVVIKPGLGGRAGPIWWRKKHFNRTCFGWNCFWASTGPMLQQFEGCWGYVGPMLCLCCAYVGLYWTIWRLCLRLFQLFLNYFFALKIMKFSAKEFGLEWCRLSHFAGCSAYVGGC